MSRRRAQRPILRAFGTIYVVLIGASFLVRYLRPPAPTPALDPVDSAVAVRAVQGTTLTAAPVRIVYREYTPSDRPPVATLLLLHGSPGHKEDFRRVGPLLANGFGYRVIAPDLPGFGDSTLDLPDYSFLAHSVYVQQLMDRLGIARAHLVAYSMAGGAALHLADRVPARVASITMLSALGVQEMELVGEYHVNHSVHALQLGALWLLREGTPHFGALDGGVVAYARNFYDSDQRPLRAILERVAMPMLIVHGTDDVLVPYEAAVEHARLVPQSELITVAGGDHFMPFRRAPFLADTIGRFVARVEHGDAPTRAQASPARLAAAARPFDPATLPRARGITAVVWTGLLAAATFVSEDLTGVTAGVLAAQGRLSFALGVTGCFLGIVVGDLLLFAAGRWIGRPIVALPPMRWLVTPGAIERASDWLARRGAMVVLISRFTPGMRLPTYVAAGVLRTSVWRFLFWFVVAAAVWTPLLVGVAMLGGRGLLDAAPPLWAVIAAVLVFAFAIRIATAAATPRGRRLLLSRWRRMTRWEFWPPYVFYAPVCAYIAWLMAKHRSATVFTAANPGIPGGGFIGESKHDILARLPAGVARTLRVPARLVAAERVRAARGLMAAAGLSFPVVVKPDQGQRGAGVAIVRTPADLEAGLADCAFDALVQEYVGGVEFGVFYYRHPSEARGRIFSITEKRFPAVTGDGRRTLERLILDDDRAVCMARVFTERHKTRLWDVPAAGEVVPLVEVGTHCRGALFLDGWRMHTEALETSIDAIARGFDGFFFGRFDVRAPDAARFRDGEFTIVELNGVTSEATHIYDPSIRLTEAWRVLMTQWRIAFEIGAENARRGAPVTPLGELVRMTRAYTKTLSEWPPQQAGHLEALP